jgi:hypothetical protein
LKNRKAQYFFKAVNQDDVFAIEGIAGDAPLDLFGQPAIESDGSQRCEFLLPLR